MRSCSCPSASSEKPPTFCHSLPMCSWLHAAEKNTSANGVCGSHKRFLSFRRFSCSHSQSMSRLLARTRLQVAHISSQATKSDTSKASQAPAQLESAMASVRSSSLYATSIFAFLVSIVAFYFLKASLNSDFFQGKGNI